MTEYLVELYAAKAHRDVVAEATARLGRYVHVIRSIFVADDETCYILVDASSTEDVRRAADMASVTFERIVETTFDIDEQPTSA